MSSLLKLRRGSALAHSTFTGSEGETTYVTDTHELVTHNGSTVGGFPGGGYMPAGVGAVPTTVRGKLRESISVRDFGAVGDGIASDDIAVTAMISAVGYVRFTQGNYLLATMTIAVPIFFEVGAYVTVPLASVLTINNYVESSRQWIFRGDGDFVLGHAGGTGEDARHVHASWFGAFPSSSVGGDAGPNINKAFASMGNLRESVVEFDVGNYRIASAVIVTRGGYVKGQGSRRTVFNSSTDGFVLFTTSGEACRFEGIQFEPLDPFTERTSAWIEIAHNNCEIKDVFAGRAFRSFLIKGNNTLIRDVGSFFNVASSVGSSLIAVQSSSNQICDVRLNTSSGFGQQFGVHIGANLGLTGAISGNVVQGINSTAQSILVCVDAGTSAVVRTIISDVMYNGFAGTAPDSAIKVISTAANNIEDLSITNVAINAQPVNGILFEQAGSGTMFDITLDNIMVSGTTGTGIRFTQTAGFINGVRIGSGVDVRNRATPISYDGSGILNIRIDPLALSNALPAACYDFTITDNGVSQINLNRSVFTGWLLVSVGSTKYITLVVRAAASPAGTIVNTSANMAVVTGALTGTTGIAGNFTVGVTDKIIYLENRLGSSQRVTAALLTGIL